MIWPFETATLRRERLAMERSREQPEESTRKLREETERVRGTARELIVPLAKKLLDRIARTPSFEDVQERVADEVEALSSSITRDDVTEFIRSLAGYSYAEGSTRLREWLVSKGCDPSVVTPEVAHGITMRAHRPLF